MKVFLAGASGAIGQRLSMLLVANGFEVTGTTREIAKAEGLEALGVTPVILDIFDEAATADAVAKAAPEVVINQLTSLSALKTGAVKEALRANSRIRAEGTPILARAAAAAGAGRFISQSIAWVYAPGPLPHREGDPLKSQVGADLATMTGVNALEGATLGTPPLEGVVLRYGSLYGPATGTGKPAGSVGVHVDAAAWAALLSIKSKSSGLFNVTDDNAEISNERARLELAWDPAFRIGD